MKIAVISDCHSNTIALDQALMDAKKENVDKYIFLGDYITDSEECNEVLDIVKEKADYLVLGNREKYVLNFDNTKKEFNNYKPIANTFHNLRKDNMDYIKSLKPVQIININGFNILLIHGDGYNASGITVMFDKLIEKYNFDICLFGHTHKFLDMKYKNKRFINPGSIGIPVDYPSYKYCIININDKIDVNLREFKTKDTFNKLKNKYLMTNYYKENNIWCNLILKSIKNGQNYCNFFISLLKNKTKNIENTSANEFNQLWKETYKCFCKNYNELNFIKFNELLIQNKLDNTKIFLEFCYKNINNKIIDKEYTLSSPIEILEKKEGASWDRVELYRKFFNRFTFKTETYFSYYNINNKDIKSYSILIYYDREKIYWFEPMVRKIYEYNNKRDLLNDFKYKFLKSLGDTFIDENYYCYMYTEPKYYINALEYYNHCTNGKKMQ